MVKRKNYNSEIQKYYEKGTYKILSEQEAEKSVKNILAKYPVRTRRTVLQQREALGTSYKQLQTFLIATERYNRNRQSRYNKAIKGIVNPAWEKFVNAQSNAWRNEIYDDNGGMTKRGWDVYNRYVDDMLADIVPTKDKSFILSESQMKYIPFEKTLLSRMEMGSPGYISERQERYFKNYETALRKSHQDADKYIKKYRELTTAQKIEFSYQSQGYIRYHYTEKDTEAVYRDFEEAIDAIKYKS